MTTYYHSISGVRFLDANRGDLSGSDNTSISSFSDDDLIIAIHLKNETAGKNPSVQTFSLEWRNITDAPGTWNPLSSSGELTYNATTDLVNGTTVTTGNWKCTDQGLTDEEDGVEREGSNADVSIDVGPDSETEYHIAVDFSGADKANGDQYGFQIVDSTESQTLSITPTVTVSSGPIEENPTGSFPSPTKNLSRKFTGARSPFGQLDIEGNVDRKALYARKPDGAFSFDGTLAASKLVTYEFKDETDMRFQNEAGYEWYPHDAISSGTLYQRSVAGGLDFGPGVSERVFKAIRNPLGALSLDAEVTRKALYDRSPSGAFDASGELNRKGIVSRSTDGELSASGVLDRKAIFPRSQDGELGASGVLDRMAIFKRAPDGELDTLGDVKRKGITARTPSGDLSASGDAARKAIFKRSELGDLDYSADVARKSWYARSFLADLNITGNVTRSVEYFRSLTRSIPAMSGEASAIVKIFRDIAGALSFAGELARKVFYKRSITGEQNLSGSVARKGLLARILSGAQSFSGDVEGQKLTGGLFQRTVSGALGFSGNLIRSLQSVTFKDEHVSFEDEVAGVSWVPKEGIDYNFYEKSTAGTLESFSGTLGRIVIFKRQLAGAI